MAPLTGRRSFYSSENSAAGLFLSITELGPGEMAVSVLASADSDLCQPQQRSTWEPPRKGASQWGVSRFLS